MFKNRKRLDRLRKAVEESIEKLREPVENQEPRAVADHLEKTLENLDS